MAVGDSLSMETKIFGVLVGLAALPLKEPNRRLYPKK